MSSHICLRVHLVWSTARREALIDPAWEHRLFAYLGTIVADRGGTMLAANGMADHLHMYVSLPATVSLAEIVGSLKANSSRWIHETFGVPAFSWQKGYGAFSVSPSADGTVRAYIENQKVHHQRRSFQEEYVEFLKRHEVEYDLRYVFE